MCMCVYVCACIYISVPSLSACFTLYLVTQLNSHGMNAHTRVDCSRHRDGATGAAAKHGGGQGVSSIRRRWRWWQRWGRQETRVSVCTSAAWIYVVSPVLSFFSQGALASSRHITEHLYRSPKGSSSSSPLLPAAALSHPHTYTHTSTCIHTTAHSPSCYLDHTFKYTHIHPHTQTPQRLVLLLAPLLPAAAGRFPGAGRGGHSAVGGGGGGGRWVGLFLYVVGWLVDCPICQVDRC